MKFVFLVALSFGRNERECLSRFPVRVQPGNKRLRVHSAVECGEIVCKGSGLESGLIAAPEHPIVVGPKQLAAFGSERLTSLRVGNLGDVWMQMRGAAMRGADVDDAAMNASVRSNVA